MRILALLSGLLAGLFGILGFLCAWVAGICGSIFSLSVVGLGIGWIAYQVPSAAEIAPTIWDLALAGVKYGFFGAIILGAAWLVSWLLTLVFGAVAAAGASS